MLERLYIKNFALINDLEIKFSSGFTVITGETGAGKTIIIETINLVCGERASHEFIRTGCDSAKVEAEFSISKNKKILEILNQLSISSDDETLIIRREIGASGKNKCIVNDNQITLSMLKQLGDLLTDIHGQHEHQSLLSPRNQLESLDSFAQLTKETAIFSKLYSEYKNLEEKIKKFESEKRERINKIDFISFQIKEIDDMKLCQGEEEALNQKAAILRNAEKLSQATSKIYSLLYENEESSPIVEQLDIVKQELKNISLMDASLKEYLTICENTIIELKEVGISILRYHDSIEFSNELQTKIEERISAIQSIKKKYGNTVSEILLYRENIQKELEELNNIEENFNAFTEQLDKLKKEIILKSQNLSEKRKESANLFNTKVERELKDLGMEKSKFIVNLQKEEITGSDGIPLPNNSFRLFPWGIDKVEFLISPNPGEEIKPLSKIASGGEISRIMLALKTICTQEDKAATIIFDEIDVGVGGEMANKIGKKLQAISLKFQVICITHLAQIASLADNHFNIYKKVKDGRTVTELNQLDTKSRIQEIARMISGDKITDLTLKHAQELIKK